MGKISIEFEVHIDTPSEVQSRARQLVVTALNYTLMNGTGLSQEDRDLIDHMMNDAYRSNNTRRSFQTTLESMTKTELRSFSDFLCAPWKGIKGTIHYLVDEMHEDGQQLLEEWLASQGDVKLF